MDLLPLCGKSQQPLSVEQIDDLIRPQSLTIAVDDVDIATQHEPPLSGVVLGLPRRGHHAAIGVGDAHIANGGDNACHVVSLLLIRFDGDEPVARCLGG